MLDFSESYGFDNQYLLQKTTELNSWCFSSCGDFFRTAKPWKIWENAERTKSVRAGVFRSKAFDWHGLHKKQLMLSTILWSNAALLKAILAQVFYCKINQSSLLRFYCRIHLTRGSEEKLLGYLKSPGVFQKYHKRFLWKNVSPSRVYPPEN